jgi:hypothetical protein
MPSELTSTFAEVVLALFIPFSIGTFFVMRPLQAALLVALGADMFLPEGPTLKIPYFPIIDKHNLPYLCILIGCLFKQRKLVAHLPREKWFLVLTLLGLVGGAATGLTNVDPYPCGENGLFFQSMNFKDGMAVSISTLIRCSLVFHLGYVLSRGREGLEKVLVGFGIAGLIYCPFAIFEMRFSPQLHNMVYGYDLGGWEMMRRWGGYRPTLFMPHGLMVARFLLGTTLALFVLAERRKKLFGLPVRLLAWFHFVVLVLCRSTGAVVLAVFGIVCIRLLKPKKQLLVASFVAVITLFYPLLRSVDLFPTKLILDASGKLQADRQGSLAFRFVNEDILLAHARERVLLGWGSYGRNRVCNKWGYDITVTDGHWIIILGVAGIAGFLIEFGVLTYPILWARRRLRKASAPPDMPCVAGFTILLALQSVDLIPNGLWCYYPYFLAGVLARRLRELSEPEAQPVFEPPRSGPVVKVVGIQGVAAVHRER